MGLLKPDSVSNPPIARLQNKKKKKITISTECATVILTFLRQQQLKSAQSFLILNC